MTDRTRREGRAMSRRQRAEARRALRAQSEGFDEFGVRLRGAALETRRRLRPVFAPLGALLGWAAPYASGALLFVAKLIAVALALILEIGQTAIGCAVARLRAAAIAGGRWLERNVTPVRTVACVCAAAAVALGVSLPQGLDAGRPGLAFSGSQAELLEGFWVEVIASAVLIFCGGLLALYSQRVTGEERRRGTRSAMGRRRDSHREAGGMSPGLQAES